MVHPKLGMKRICQSCDAKFFDLNKKPITCPKCETELVLNHQKTEHLAKNKQKVDILAQLKSQFDVNAVEDDHDIDEIFDEVKNNGFVSIATDISSDADL